MKSLFSKILLALAVSTVLALLLTTVMSRVALQRGFMQFLEQQEQSQLRLLAPELTSLYERTGDWSYFQDKPRNWMRLLARARPEGVRPPEEAPAEFQRRRHHPPLGDVNAPDHMRANPPGDDPRRLWRRLFLLDRNHEWVAGATSEPAENSRMVAIEVDGATVGWLGFQPVGEVAAPEAQRYLAYQNRALLLSLMIALILALVLAYLLARNLSRPVARLRDTLRQLTRGDFTARAGVASHDEISDLARNVNRLAQTLEKNESARRRWTADVAHELRTPLAVLQGELDAVKDGVRPFSPAMLDSVSEEVHHLTKLVDDLQTLALADAGALDIRLEPLDFAGLARQVLEAFGARVSAAGLRLETELPDRLEMLGDAQRLRQLVHNLLENSCRYTQSGGRIRVSLKLENERVSLLVEDSSPGVEAAQREHLFERFYRVEPSRGRAAGGSGMGLAICHNLVEAHGGEITADDSPLGGLAIHVQLPRTP